jgi:hypothetical protein
VDAPEKYISELKEKLMSELAIHRRVGRLNYLRRCAEKHMRCRHIRNGVYRWLPVRRSDMWLLMLPSGK